MSFRSSAWPVVVRRLHEADAAGWDPAQLLSAVAAQRELGSADSVAEVLAWRLDGYLAAHSAPEPAGSAPPPAPESLATSASPGT